MCIYYIVWATQECLTSNLRALMSKSSNNKISAFTFTRQKVYIKKDCARYFGEPSARLWMYKCGYLCVRSFDYTTHYLSPFWRTALPLLLPELSFLSLFDLWAGLCPLAMYSTKATQLLHQWLLYLARKLLGNIYKLCMHQDFPHNSLGNLHNSPKMHSARQSGS